MPGELIVRLGQRDQPAFEASHERLAGFRAARGLRRERLHGGERILDPVIQFVDQKPLPLFGRLRSVMSCATRTT